MKKNNIIKRVFLSAGILLVVALVVFLAVNRVPIEKKYRLEDVKENQAVMMVEYCHYGNTKIAVVTKDGRWKCTDITELERDNMSLPVKERRDFIEIIDEVMADETIPYQEKELTIGKNLLEKAINLPRFRFSYVEKTDMYETITEPVCNYYSVVGTGDDRTARLIGTIGQDPFVRMQSTWLRFDIDIIRMIQKLDKLDDMRKEVME